MSKSVNVDIASLPKDAEVEVRGLGLFLNGHKKKLTDEQVEAYEAAGHTLPEGDFEIGTNYQYPQGKTELPEGETRMVEALEASREQLQKEQQAQQEASSERENG